MFKHKVAAVAAVAALGLGLGASGASALTSPTAIGDSIQGKNFGGKIALGNFISCDSTLNGTVTSDNGVGLGGGGSITGGSFSSCTIFTSAAGNFGTPWSLSIVHTPGVDAPGTGKATITGISVNVSAGGTCTYTGSLTGTAVEASGVLTLAGSLNKSSGSCLGGATESVSGRYQLTNLTTSPSQPRLLF